MRITQICRGFCLELKNDKCDANISYSRCYAWNICLTPHLGMSLKLSESYDRPLIKTIDRVNDLYLKISLKF